MYIRHACMREWRWDISAEVERERESARARVWERKGCKEERVIKGNGEDNEQTVNMRVHSVDYLCFYRL